MDDEMIARRVFASHAQGAPLVAANKAARMLRECGLPLTSGESSAVLAGAGGLSSQISEEDFVGMLQRARAMVGDARATAIAALRDLNRLRGIDCDYIAEKDLCAAVEKFGNSDATYDVRAIREAMQRANLKRDACGRIHIECFVSEVLLL